MRRIPRVGETVLCVLLLSALGASDGAALAGWEIDATATATRVIDGDTFDAVPVGRVRLADVDAPEIGQLGSREATAHLILLVHRTLVYLDIDDAHGTDRYGRVVAVVYVRHNATHLLNVNAALVSAGHARMWDFPNEFDPTLWNAYIFLPNDGPGDRTPETKRAVYVAITTLSITLFAVWATRRMARARECTLRSRQACNCYETSR